MPSIKDLKKRITTVKNTQQTTRAMKMVSAAKLRRAQEAIQSQRPYAKRMGELIRLVSNLQEGESAASVFVRKDEGTVGSKKVLVLVVTSDRGLCGAFNGSVIKATQRWLAANQANYAEVKLGFVGRKGNEFFKTKKVGLGPYYNDVTGKVSFAKAKKLADALVELFVSGEYDEIKIIYNEFKNAVSQKVVIEDFLPLAEPAVSETDANGQVTEIPNYVVKPDAAHLLEKLLAKNFSMQTFRVLLESQAGEHGARMSAMENATKNAGEMIKKLTLQYNKQRQAGITKELLEIISGSESQKGK